MQDLLNRITELDPDSSVSLRIIACFDELIRGRVNTRALLAAAASLSGCVAGVTDSSRDTTFCLAPSGESTLPDPTLEMTSHQVTDHTTVWLQHSKKLQTHDLVILERLALAIHIRRTTEHVPDQRKLVEIVTDQSITEKERSHAASRLGLLAGHRYRIAAAPLLAGRLEKIAHCPGDVLNTPYGQLLVRIIPESTATIDESPCGIGVAVAPHDLPWSLATAMVALRLNDTNHRQTSTNADRYGGLLEILVNTEPDTQNPDLDAIHQISSLSWGEDTIGALVDSTSLRQLSRTLGLHHSTVAKRVDVIREALGFDPMEGYGKTRLGLAWLLWQLQKKQTVA